MLTGVNLFRRWSCPGPQRCGAEALPLQVDQRYDVAQPCATQQTVAVRFHNESGAKRAANTEDCPFPSDNYSVIVPR